MFSLFNLTQSIKMKEVTSEIITKQLQEFGNPEKAAHATRFFKTGKGQYGEGDLFIGVTVPEIRAVAKIHKNLSMHEIEKLLHDKIHEYRLCALIILVNQFKKADDVKRQAIFDIYLANTHYINNWDLVDVSAKDILGEFLIDKKRDKLYELAQSDLLWEQRIAIVATYAFIKKSDFDDTLRLSEQFLSHPHDLMHKACGWMLREAGKRDEKMLIAFLDAHYRDMPRTMLRYSIEKLSSEQKQHYMQK